MILVIYGYGHFRTEKFGNLLKEEPRQGVALIQGNIDQNIKWERTLPVGNARIFTVPFPFVPSLPKSGLIVWPETAAPFYFEQPDPLQGAVVDVARSSGSMLLFGSPSYEGENGEVSYMNSAYILRPDGMVRDDMTRCIWCLTGSMCL